MKFGYLTPLLGVLLFSGSLWALDSAEVLPKGVRRVSVRGGLASGMHEKFSDSGSLVNLGEQASLHVDSQMLRQMDPKAGMLIDNLNAFGPYRLGDALSLGTMRIEATPEVQYKAFTFALGATENYTIGIGIPQIRFQNRVAISQSGSNVAEIRRQLEGRISPELDAALRAVDVNLAADFSRRLTSGGYSPLGSVDREFLGDIQIVNLWRLHKAARLTGALKGVVVLPTGPQDDPDSVSDTDAFHRTNLAVTWLEDYRPHRSWVIGAKLGGTVGLPDRITKRVPRDEADVLPDHTRKEELLRDPGDLLTAELNTRIKLGSLFEVGVGMEENVKSADRYAGVNGWNYYLLEKNTASRWEVVKASAELTTVDMFLQKRFAVPLSAQYQWTNVVSGQNVPRQEAHEIELTLFF